jgi:hypothetical protein
VVSLNYRVDGDITEIHKVLHPGLLEARISGITELVLNSLCDFVLGSSISFQAKLRVH